MIRFAGSVASFAAKRLVGSLQVRCHFFGPPAAPVTIVPEGARYIYSIWHENLLIPAARFGHPDLAVLISRHADGQLLGTLIERMGMGMVLGSTNRGGIEAVRSIVKGTAGRRHLAVTPDGPRGPRRVVQPGMIYAASRTGMQIVPVGVACARHWRVRSWDRFMIPKPGSKACLVFAEPISVPNKLSMAELEPYQALVQAEMERMTTMAESWIPVMGSRPAPWAVGDRG